MAERWPVRMPVGMRTEDRVPVATSWRYRPCEPWAVTVAFTDPRVNDGGAPTWTFARDLLAVGLHRPAGIGDVQLWPEYDILTPVMVMRLSSPDGEVVLTVQSADVERFLVTTYGWVPAGDEARFVDVDAAVARLLEVGSC